MAFTRKMLKAMGIEDEKIDEIMEAHGEVVDALKEQRDGYKVDADKLPGVQRELDELKESGGGSDFEQKYNDEHQAFEDYKTKIAEEKVNGVKDKLYRELLKSLKVDPKRIDTIMKVTDLKDVKVKDGKLEDSEDLSKSIKADWADFMTHQRTEEPDVEDPPGGNDGEDDLGSMSMDEYIAARKKM